jgi:hypothetical protein
VMFPTGSTNGSSRAAIRPSRLALKPSVTLTLALASRSSLAHLPGARDLRQRCLYFGMDRIQVGSGLSILNLPRWWRGCDIMYKLPHIAG